MFKIIKIFILTLVCASPWALLAFLSIYLVWDTQAEFLPESLREIYSSGFFFLGIGIAFLTLSQILVALVAFYYEKPFKKVFQTTALEGIWEAIPDMFAAFFCGAWLGQVITIFKTLSDYVNGVMGVILFPLLLSIYLGEFFLLKNRIQQIKNAPSQESQKKMTVFAYLQSIFQLLFWFITVYGIILVVDQYMYVQEEELGGILLIAIILAYSWLLKQILKRSEKWLFEHAKIGWISGY